MNPEIPSIQPQDEGPRFRGGTPESDLVYEQEKDSEFGDLIESHLIKSAVENADETLKTLFIGSGCREAILKVTHPEDQKLIALEEIRKNPGIIPNDIRGDDDDEAAFAIVLARHVNKPPYRN